MANPKKKGNAFENKVAKILSDYLGKEFIRSPSSGAMATKTNRQKLAGDLICIDGYFPYTIECKHYKTVDFSGLLKGTGDIIKWLEQLDREKGEKKGLLIFKANYSPIYCAIESDIELPNSFKYKSYVFCLFNDVLPFLKSEVKGG